ncbi:hypothetical protein CMMCAS04_06500 [Clavibacter michiganensis subsp. michiganensis]|nr:hypothetical protein CMMCAS04_06500 [Clavibacter michiganensis subsp. michiganensis]
MPGDEPLVRDGEQPVAVDAHHEGRRPHAGERRLDAAAVAAHVVRAHRVDEADVAGRVEAPGELVAVEVEVRLHGVPPLVAHGADAALPRAGEPLVELIRAAVVQQRHAAGEGEAAVRAVAVGRVEVVAVAVGGIHPDRLGLHGVERDLVGAGDGGGREDREPAHPAGEPHAPLERLHASHGPADDRRPHVDAERVGEGGLHGDLVADGDEGEARAPLGAVGRQGGGAGRALAAAQHVGGDHEPAVRVDGEARTHDARPPSARRLPGTRRSAEVAVARERVKHQHGVAPVGVALAEGLVGDPHRRDPPARLQVDAPHRREQPVGDGVALAPRARRGRSSDQGADLRVRHQARRDGVLGCLPVHPGQ